MIETGRRTVTLGDVLVERREKVPVKYDAEYPIAGVYGFGRGILLRDSVKGASISAAHLYRISAGQIIYSRLKAFEGAFALVPESANGRYVSNEFPTFDVHESQALPAYIALVLSTATTWRELAGFITGVGARRERLQVADFLNHEFDLPSLAEQHRIVAITEAAAGLVAALQEERHAAAGLVRSLQADIDGADFPEATLDEALIRFEAGKSPKCFDRRPSHDEWGVLKVSAIREGRFIAEEAKALPPTVPAFERAKVREGDVLVSRANTSELVGAVCRVLHDPGRVLLCDKTLRLVIDEARVVSDYLVEAMAVPTVREQIVLAATGSSASMLNISQDSLRDIVLPLPDWATQTRVAQQAVALRARLAALDSEATAAEFTRVALIEDLVVGARDVGG